MQRIGKARIYIITRKNISSLCIQKAIVNAYYVNCNLRTSSSSHFALSSRHCHMHGASGRALLISHLHYKWRSKKKIKSFQNISSIHIHLSICVVPVRTLHCFWIRAFLFICCTGSFQWKERLLVQTYTHNGNNVPFIDIHINLGGVH